MWEILFVITIIVIIIYLFVTRDSGLEKYGVLKVKVYSILDDFRNGKLGRRIILENENDKDSKVFPDSKSGVKWIMWDPHTQRAKPSYTINADLDSILRYETWSINDNDEKETKLISSIYHKVTREDLNEGELIFCDGAIVRKSDFLENFMIRFKDMPSQTEVRIGWTPYRDAIFSSTDPDENKPIYLLDSFTNRYEPFPIEAFVLSSIGSNVWKGMTFIITNKGREIGRTTITNPSLNVLVITPNLITMSSS